MFIIICSKLLCPVSEKDHYIRFKDLIDVKLYKNDLGDK